MGLKERALGAFGARRFLVAVSVFSAAMIVVCANVLVHRFYARWDVTSARLFSLSDATVETLRGLDEPVEVFVFLGRGDPLLSSTRKLLDSYSAETQWLSVRHVDPDDDPAEFLALQRKYDLAEGKTADGRLASDAIVVIARGTRSWFVTADDVVSVDRNDGEARPALEQALTEGLRSVVVGERVSVCITTGHGEASPDDGGPSGLGELRYRMEKDNYDVRLVDLSGAGSLGGCRLVLVAGPTRPLSNAATGMLADHVRGGGSLALFVSPVFDSEGHAISLGLDPLTSLVGVALGEGLVVEADPAKVVSLGWGGEVFRATPKPHEITSGLMRGASSVPVQVSMAQSVDLGPDSSAVPLLTTSERAGVVLDLRRIIDEGHRADALLGDRRGQRVLAVAGVGVAGESGSDGRVVVAGMVNPLLSAVWRDPRLIDDKAFTESALAWLTARPPLVSVPQKPVVAAGLSLTQDDYASVVRYVLVYMPTTALLLGLLVMIRRRQKLPRSRSGAA